MFSNAQQSIPERFIAKMEIDSQVKELQDIISDAYSGDYYTLEDLRVLREKLQPVKDQLVPLLEKQEHLRKSCAAFIADRKARGPEGTA